MRLTYDPKTDAAYIYMQEIGKGDVAKTLSVPFSGCMLDFDKHGHLVGIEVLGVEKRCPIIKQLHSAQGERAAVAQELRTFALQIRRKPFPISELIPILTRAADAVDPEKP
jgi:uncharacterized protein YuzE